MIDDAELDAQVAAARERLEKSAPRHDELDDDAVFVKSINAAMDRALTPSFEIKTKSFPTT